MGFSPEPLTLGNTNERSHEARRVRMTAPRLSENTDLAIQVRPMRAPGLPFRRPTFEEGSPRSSGSEFRMSGSSGFAGQKNIRATGRLGDLLPAHGKCNELAGTLRLVIALGSREAHPFECLDSSLRGGFNTLVLAMEMLLKAEFVLRPSVTQFRGPG